MAHDDDIDELVSSVRDFIARQDSAKSEPVEEKLVLTTDDMVAESKDAESEEVSVAGQAKVLRLGSGGTETQIVDAAPIETPAAVVEETPKETPVVPLQSGPREVLAGVDERALRALIEQVVREELSNELGEQITQNMRKLVRREINRVLTSREMAQD